MDRLLISVDEMAEMLGIGRNVAYALTHRKDFPALRAGKRVLISVEGLKRWIHEHEGEKVSL